MTSYRVTDQAVEIVLFHLFVLKKIPFDNIKKIQILSLFKLRRSFSETFKTFITVPCVRGFANKFSNTFMLLTLKETGIIPRLLITPNKPEEFVNKLKQRIEASKGISLPEDFVQHGINSIDEETYHMMFMGFMISIIILGITGGIIYIYIKYYK